MQISGHPPPQNHWLRISGSRAQECAFLISASDSDVANQGLMFWDTLWPNEEKWAPAYSLQWPALGQEWSCLSHEVGLGCTARQSFNRVIMSKKGQPCSLLRRDQVQPGVSELSCQEFSRAYSHLLISVLLICVVCSTSDMQCWVSEGTVYPALYRLCRLLIFCVLHAQLVIRWHVTRTWRSSVAQVLCNQIKPLPGSMLLFHFPYDFGD